MIHHQEPIFHIAKLIEKMKADSELRRKINQDLLAINTVQGIKEYFKNNKEVDKDTKKKIADFFRAYP